MLTCHSDHYTWETDRTPPRIRACTHTHTHVRRHEHHTSNWSVCPQNKEGPWLSFPHHSCDVLQTHAGAPRPSRLALELPGAGEAAVRARAPVPTAPREAGQQKTQPLSGRVQTSSAGGLRGKAKMRLMKVLSRSRSHHSPVSTSGRPACDAAGARKTPSCPEGRLQGGTLYYVAPNKYNNPALITRLQRANPEALKIYWQNMIR